MSWKSTKSGIRVVKVQTHEYAQKRDNNLMRLKQAEFRGRKKTGKQGAKNCVKNCTLYVHFVV